MKLSEELNEKIKKYENFDGRTLKNRIAIIYELLLPKIEQLENQNEQVTNALISIMQYEYESDCKFDSRQCCQEHNDFTANGKCWYQENIKLIEAVKCMKWEEIIRCNLTK